jgi:hypothetical protein
VIALDADLSQRGVDTIVALLAGADAARQGYNPEIRVMINRHFLVYAHQAAWTAHLEGSLRAGQRCLVVMGSRGALERDVLDKVVARVNAWREEEEGGSPLVVRDYTSATGDDRKEDFCAIEAAWTGCDLVAYTPCVTVGSSFDLRDVFDRVYMYADARTATPRVMNQMAGRVRHPKSHVVHTFIAGGGGGKRP